VSIFFRMPMLWSFLVLAPLCWGFVTGEPVSCRCHAAAVLESDTDACGNGTTGSIPSLPVSTPAPGLADTFSYPVVALALGFGCFVGCQAIGGRGKGPQTAGSAFFCSSFGRTSPAYLTHPALPHALNRDPSSPTELRSPARRHSPTEDTRLSRPLSRRRGLSIPDIVVSRVSFSFPSGPSSAPLNSNFLMPPRK
jgi:hypothetical protein